MTIIDKSALIPQSAEKMYQLVLDINRYSEFLPWCERAEVLSQSETMIKGRIQVAHMAFKQSFVTENQLVKNQMIRMKLLEGPFKSLDGVWRFTRLEENASKISLHMAFEFKSKLVSMALTPVFSQIADSMVDSFCQRAMHIYPQNSNL